MNGFVMPGGGNMSSLLSEPSLVSGFRLRQGDAIKRRFHPYIIRLCNTVYKKVIIAPNNCIDFIRRKKTNTFSIDKTFENEEGSEMSMDLRSETPDPEENVMKKEKVRHMREVVEKLKPRYRILVELRYFEELSYEEISQKLELPIGTVKAQLFRARELLLNVLRHSRENL